MWTSRTSNPARFRFRPPGPSAESRRSWVSCASGLVWSTTCDSSPRPKKYSIAALMLLGLIRRPRRHVLGVLEAHPLLDGPAELEEPLAELVGGQLVDRPEPAVAQVVDVVDVPLPLAQVEDVADRVDVVDRVQGHLVFGDRLVELPVDPEPADLAEAVAVGVEELLVEQLAGLLELRRVAGPEPLVDPQQRALVVGGRVFLERLEDERVLGLLQDGDVAEVGVGQDLRRGLRDRRAALDRGPRRSSGRRRRRRRSALRAGRRPWRRRSAMASVS